MAFFPRRVAQVLFFVTVLVLMASSVRAQSPAPDPPAQQPPAPAPQPAPEPPPVPEAPPTKDPTLPPVVEPKPAGVGSSEGAKPDSDVPAATAPAYLPPTSFPGVPESGTALSGRPFTGVFSGAQPVSQQGSLLALSGSLFAAYSSNVQPITGGVSSVPEVGEASSVAGANGSLVYERGWNDAAIGAHLNANRAWISAFRGTDNEWQTRWDVGMDGGFGKNLSDRVRLTVSGNVAYSPYLQFGLFNPTAGNIGSRPLPIPGLDYALARDPSVMATGTSSLSYALNQRSSIEAYYSLLTQTFVASDPQNFDRFDQIAGGRYHYQFSRYVGMHVGYGYRHATVGGPDAEPITNHLIDAGLDAGYGHSYALTKQTTFSFSTSSQIFASGGTTGNPGGNNSSGFDQQSHFFVGGSADLVHTMGRSWTARTGYRRDVGYQVGFDLPFLSDTAYGSVYGFITPRLDLDATASYAGGQVGFGRQNNGYSNQTAVATLRYGITRNLATYAQYFYYGYHFDHGVTLPGYLAPDLTRQGVSVGLTAWLPLHQSRGRR